LVQLDQSKFRTASRRRQYQYPRNGSCADLTTALGNMPTAVHWCCRVVGPYTSKDKLQLFHAHRRLSCIRDGVCQFHE
jgi:hypothetical protein